MILAEICQHSGQLSLLTNIQTKQPTDIECIYEIKIDRSYIIPVKGPATALFGSCHHQP